MQIIFLTIIKKNRFNTITMKRHNRKARNPIYQTNGISNFMFTKNNIEKLSSHLNSYKTFHDKLGNTISTVVNHYNKTSQEFNKIDKDVTRLAGEKHSIGFDVELLEKPNSNENN